MSLLLCVSPDATTVSFVCGLWLHIKKAETLSCFWRICLKGYLKHEKQEQIFFSPSTVHSQIIIKLLLIHDGKWHGTG